MVLGVPDISCALDCNYLGDTQVGVFTMKRATRTPGGFGGDYLASGSTKGGVSHSVRRKVDAEKLKLLRAWRAGLRGVLKTGAGLDVHLDMAMQELVDELTERIDSF